MVLLSPLRRIFPLPNTLLGFSNDWNQTKK